MILILPVFLLGMISNSMREKLFKNRKDGTVPTQEQLNKVFVTLLSISLVLLIFTCPSEEKKKDPAMELKNKIDSCGYTLVAITEKQMLDPDAFKLREMTWIPTGKGTYIYTITFTSTNAFGGRIPGMIQIEADADCKGTKVINQVGF